MATPATDFRAVILAHFRSILLSPRRSIPLARPLRIQSKTGSAKRHWNLLCFGQDSKWKSTIPIIWNTWNMQLFRIVKSMEILCLGWCATPYSNCHGLKYKICSIRCLKVLHLWAKTQNLSLHSSGSSTKFRKFRVRFRGGSKRSRWCATQIRKCHEGIYPGEPGFIVCRPSVLS